MKSIIERVKELENKDNSKEIKNLLNRVEFLEDIIENKLGLYIPKK